MSIKTYQLYCDYCGYKRITDGSDIKDLVEVKQSPIPSGIPYKDAETNKIVTPKPLKRKKAFKCPGCGRLIKAKRIEGG